MSVAGWPKYDSYKDSCVAWIGKIPSTWRVERGKWLFVKRDRPVRPGDEVVTCFRDGQVTLRRNRRTEGFTNALKEHGYQGIRKGDLVIHAMDAFAGAVGVSDSDGKATPVYSVCVPRGPDIADPFFFAYYMRHLALSGLLVSLAKGIRERTTDFRYNDFADLKLAVPPLPEQRAISRFLDETCARVDEAVRIRERQIALLRERRQILIQQAVTRGLNPAAPMKDSGVDWIGQIPAHWEVVPLRRVSRIHPGNGFPVELQGDEEGTIPFLKVSDFSSNDTHVGSANNYVSEKTAKSRKWNKVPAGAIVTAKIGEALRKNHRNVLAVEAIIDNNCVAFEASGINQRYFFWLHKVIDFEWFVNPGAVPSISMTMYKSEKVPLPPDNEQIEIAENIEMNGAKIEDAISLKEQQIAALREYKASLIDAAVTGKIRVTEQAAGHATARPETVLSAQA